MKTTCILLISLAVLVLTTPAKAQTSAETILPAIIPSGTTAANAASASAIVPAPAKSPAVKPTPAKPVFAENSSPTRVEPVVYYRPVGAVSPMSGIRTYPGNTAAHITNGATRVSMGVPAGSTFARIVGSNGSRATRPSTKARTVSTR
ncbi:hypothetical protein [Prosthecobacter vanneervenii]|uniref:Uncharacterized protein n=1 Tax=Prosthecobacter vanneervenii TaxID=48466 RepID=A0A7W7YAH7_9BACT|nr:hypothetical protein [Prosthecobacter vanneervenii]MBB5032514.1 hypothetical protein [Prosthecobacter vanneervenii]